jgi:large subunit ribosomal protein L25
METFSLQASRRTVTGKAVDHVRKAQHVPAVMYGHGVESVNLEVDAIALLKLIRQAGTSSLVDLSIDGGAPTKVLIHAVQHHPTRQTYELEPLKFQGL